MAQDQLFNDLCKPQVLKIGWHLAQLDSRDDFIQDPMRNADFASQLDVRLGHIIEQIASSRYRPRHLIDVDIPKSALTVRPGNVLPIEEAAVLHAIVYLIAPRLDPLLSSRVYSYRLHKNWKRRVEMGRSLFEDDELELPFLRRATIKRFDPMESWYIAWPEFDAARKAALKDRKFSHVSKTDISAYFENIDLRLLEDLLKRRLRNEPKLLGLLFRILNAWTRDTAAGVSIGRGLPQGNDISSFLGNLYLMDLDRELTRFCRNRRGEWYRYVDDVDILTRSFEDAREVLLLVNRVLRSIHLNLQGSKTRILFGKELQDEYSDRDGEAVGDLIAKLQKLDPRSASYKSERRTILRKAGSYAKRFTRRLPRSIRSLSQKENRLLRRLMTLYGMAGSARLKRTALACLREEPERRLLEKSLRYLSRLEYRHHAEVATTLLDIGSDASHITQYQLAAIASTIAQLHPEDPRAIASRVRQIALENRSEWLVKQKAAEALFALPYRPQYATRIAIRLLNDTHPWVRRAAMLLLLKGDVGSAKQTIERLMFHPDASLHLPSLLWKRYEADQNFRRVEMQRMESIRGDHALMKNVYRLWALSLGCTQEEWPRMHRILDRFSDSRSATVNWHVSEIRKRCPLAA